MLQLLKRRGPNNPLTLCTQWNVFVGNLETIGVFCCCLLQCQWMELNRICTMSDYSIHFAVFFAVRPSDQLTSKVCQSKQLQIISVFVCSHQWFFCGGLVAVHTILSKWLYWRSRISLLKFYTIFYVFMIFT